MHTHHLTLDTLPFSQVASGAKVIESRLYDEKRKKITVGDTIIFTERSVPKNILHATVVALYLHATFTELFASHDASLFGNADRDFLSAQIRTFYTLDEERAHGVIGIHFVINH